MSDQNTEFLRVGSPFPSDDENLGFISEAGFLRSLLDHRLDNEARLAITARLEDVVSSQQMSGQSIALRRVPAIFLTVILELLVGLIIYSFKTTTESHPTLVSLLPLISSVCGNIGLQSSASTMKALFSQSGRRNFVLRTVRREFSISLAIGFVIGGLLYLIVAFWTKNSRLGFVSGISIFLSSAAAAVIGAMSPIVFSSFGLDPTLCAGPFETAIEDVVGISLFLAIAKIVL